jgi:hypothetical protein
VRAAIFQKKMGRANGEHWRVNVRQVVDFAFALSSCARAVYPLVQFATSESVRQIARTLADACHQHTMRVVQSMEIIKGEVAE